MTFFERNKKYFRNLGKVPFLLQRILKLLKEEMFDRSRKINSIQKLFSSSKYFYFPNLIELLTPVQMQLLYPLVHLLVFVPQKIRVYQRFLVVVGRQRLGHRHLVFLEVDEDFLLRLEVFLLEAVGFYLVEDFRFVFVFVQLVDLELGDVVD